MDILRQHDIAEANHRILKPLTDDKLMLLGRLCRLGAGQRHLDFACGNAEMLCRFAAPFGSSGFGVDVSEFVSAGHARARKLGVTQLVRLEQGDAREVPIHVAPRHDTTSYDARRSHLQYGRRFFGRGVFVLRPQ